MTISCRWAKEDKSVKKGSWSPKNMCTINMQTIFVIYISKILYVKPKAEVFTSSTYNKTLINF